MTRAAVLALAITLAACGHDDTPPPQPDGNRTFVAFPSTFQTFRSWHMVHSNGPDPNAGFPTDVLGPRSQYISQLPPKGSKEFPVGTVIVEARESGAMKIFAAAKRGNNYNSGGADNWEWFELSEDADTKAVNIVWRGTAPPPTDTYGGAGRADCNACHRACGSNNDFVCSPGLQLAEM